MRTSEPCPREICLNYVEYCLFQGNYSLRKKMIKKKQNSKIKVTQVASTKNQTTETTSWPTQLSSRLEEMVERNLKKIAEAVGQSFEDFVEDCLGKLKDEVDDLTAEETFLILLEEIATCVVEDSMDLYGEAELPDFFVEVNRLTKEAIDYRLSAGILSYREGPLYAPRLRHLTMLHLFSEKYQEAHPELSRDLALLYELRSHGYWNL